MQSVGRFSRAAAGTASHGLHGLDGLDGLDGTLRNQSAVICGDPRDPRSKSFQLDSPRLAWRSATTCLEQIGTAADDADDRGLVLSRFARFSRVLAGLLSNCSKPVSPSQLVTRWNANAQGRANASGFLESFASSAAIRVIRGNPRLFQICSKHGLGERSWNDLGTRMIADDRG